MSVNGSFSTNQTTLLDPAQLPPYPLQDLPQATRQLWLDVNQTESTVWVLHRVPFQDNNNQVLPLLFDPRPDPGVFSVSETEQEVIDVVMQVSLFVKHSSKGTKMEQLTRLRPLFTVCVCNTVRSLPIVLTPWPTRSICMATISESLVAKRIRCSLAT
jgi:hypothetical protein